MRRALLLAVVVVTCSCGQSVQHGEAGGDVSLLHVSVTLPDGSRKEMGREWYRSSTGEYDARGGLFGPGGRRVFLTSEFVRQSGETGLMVLTGSRPFVERAGDPSLFESPGVALYREYLEHTPQSAGYHVRATHADDGRLVLEFSVAIPTDSGTPPRRLAAQVTVDPPVSMQRARDQGAFVLPRARPDVTVTESPPGSPSRVGLHPWWLGAAWEGKTARTVIEEASTLRAPPGNESIDIPPGGSYQVAYRVRATPADAGLEPPGVPSVPGVGNIPKGEVYVTSFRPDAKRPLEAGGSSTPITVGGRPATFILPGPGITPGLFWVRTSDALVEVRLWYEMDATPQRMRTVAEQLHPVP
jgi:hypothetical protein